ncbi:DUF3515 family protein [Jatrophihabitans sp. YIM 134969]
MVLVVAFLVGETGGGNAATPGPSATPGPLRTSVPDLDQATAKVCDPVMQSMPVTLDDGETKIQPLVVTPGGPSFLAWGDPLVTLQCGVPRPSWLRDDLDYGTVNQITSPAGYGASWVARGTGDRVTFTVIDRAVYFEAVLPKGDAPFLVQISDVIGRALPQVCTQPTPGDPPDAKYCGSRP